MDRLEAMQVFIAVIDTGNLAGAARTLRRSPAAVSRAIAFLEAHLGAALLTRSTRVVRLTEAGEQYASSCRRILSEIKDAELLASGARATPQGVLTISAPPISGEEILRPLVDEFLQLHPAVSVRLLLLDRAVNLLEEGVDVALRVGELPDSALKAIKVGSEVRRVLVAAPHYLAAAPPIDRPADLTRHAIVALDNFGVDRWLFPPGPGAAAPLTVSFTPRLLVNTVRAAAAACVAGLGVTRLYSYHVAQHVRRGELEIVLADAEPPPVSVHLLVQPGRAPLPKVRAFLDLATPRLRASFTGLAADARGLARGAPPRPTAAL